VGKEDVMEGSQGPQNKEERKKGNYPQLSETRGLRKKRPHLRNLVLRKLY